MSVRLLEGDCRTLLPTLPAESVHCVVTSPPYWGLRDYGCEGQLGLEPTPEEYVATMVAVFRAVRRVLRADGTLWCNLGDAFQDKQLLGMPWRLAFALQADGWYLRADIIWAKPNPMPESVTDRPTKAHEYIFLLTKSARYFYDAEAVREPAIHAGARIVGLGTTKPFDPDRQRTLLRGERTVGEHRNLRSVWTIRSAPFPDAHFATFPSALAQRCILAGCPQGGTVLDSFAGSGTVGAVAEQLGRHSVLIELSPAYVRMAEQRTAQYGLFAQERTA
jgi:site-specific DNA-methyltransferase (adenine-specific)